jgi:hypothetical protein
MINNVMSKICIRMYLLCDVMHLCHTAIFSESCESICDSIRDSICDSLVDLFCWVLKKKKK